MVNTTILPDSSFYVCFLGDINKPQYLRQLLSWKTLKFVIGQLIKEEIKRSPNYHMIEDIVESHIQIFRYYEYGEILRPVFSLEEIKRGDHEIIVISYILCFFGIDFIAILDDKSLKKFLQRNFPKILTKVTGTVGFLKLCCCSYKIFSRKEAISILDSIKKSKFRIKGEIVDGIIEEIKRC